MTQLDAAATANNPSTSGPAVTNKGISDVVNEATEIPRLISEGINITAKTPFIPTPTSATYLTIFAPALQTNSQCLSKPLSYLGNYHLRISP
jgi:hypothetical protein